MHTRTHIVTRLIGLCILLMATTRGLAQQEPPATGDEAALLAVLQSDAPIFNRAKACQQLAVVGTKTSVPVLAKLLSDEQMSHYARVALEPLADPSVDEALRASTGTLKGGLLVGVINTIGMRRDTGATGRLKELLGDTDPQVAAAAAAALGRLASSKSMEILQSSLASDAPLKFAVADACLTAADTLLTHGKRAEATRLYDALRQAELPKYLQIAALSGAIRARGPDGVDLLVAQLKSADEDFFGVGLSMAHLVPGDRVTQALLEELSKPLPEPTEKVKILVINKAEYGAQDKWVDVTSQVSAAVQGNGISIRAGNQIAGDPISNVVKSLKVSYTLDDEPKTVEVPEGGVLDIAGHIPSNPRQATVIAVLGKRGDKAALPAVLSAAKDAPWDVRLPAIRALARIGDATAVPLLLETASSAQGALSDAALDSLADLPDQATDERIAAMLADSRGQQRLVVIELLGRREISSSVPALLDLVGSDDPATRKAVVASLGLTVGLEDLGALLQQLVKPVSAEDAAAVKAALQTASLRMPDRDAAAQLFLDRMKRRRCNPKKTCLICSEWSAEKRRSTESSQRPARRTSKSRTRRLASWGVG